MCYSKQQMPASRQAVCGGLVPEAATAPRRCGTCRSSACTARLWPMPPPMVRGSSPVQQHLVEGQLAAVVAARQRQLAVQGRLRPRGCPWRRSQTRSSSTAFHMQDIAVELPSRHSRARGRRAACRSFSLPPICMRKTVWCSRRMAFSRSLGRQVGIHDPPAPAW